MLTNRDLLLCNSAKYWSVDCVPKTSKRHLRSRHSTPLSSSQSFNRSFAHLPSTPSFTPQKASSPSMAEANASSSSDLLTLGDPLQDTDRSNPNKICFSLFQQLQGWRNSYDSHGKSALALLLRFALNIYKTRIKPPPPSAELQKELIAVAESLESLEPCASISVLSQHLNSLQNHFCDKMTGISQGQKDTFSQLDWRDAAMLTYEKKIGVPVENWSEEDWVRFEQRKDE